MKVAAGRGPCRPRRPARARRVASPSARRRARARASGAGRPRATRPRAAPARASPTSLSIGARQTSSRGPSSSSSPSRTSRPVTASNSPAPSPIRAPSRGRCCGRGGDARRGLRDRQLAEGDLVAGGRPRLVLRQHRADRQPGLAALRRPGQRGPRQRDRLAGRRPARDRARPPPRPRPRPRAPTRSAGARGRGSRGGWRSRPAPIRTGANTALSSSSPGEGVRSGQQEPVGDEVAVVQRLAEVAAVGEVALRRGGCRGRSTPTRSRRRSAGARSNSAWYSTSPPGPLPIACAYSHSRNGFARRAASSPGSSSGGSSRRPSASTSACVGYMRLCTSPSVAVQVVLVVQRPRRVALARPVGHRDEVAPDPALVAERPHDHARVVLVALDRALDPVEVRLAPAGVVARVAAPADLLEAVRLEVALGDHVQAVARRRARGSADAAGSGSCAPR